MADISVEKNDVPVVEKEVEEVAAPKVVEADEDEKAVVENGAADESTEESESARENGDAEKEDAGNKDDEDDDTEEDEAETANGDSTEAPEQVLKRKQDVTAADTVSEEVTPEKKQKIEEANEVDANGADAEVVA